MAERIKNMTEGSPLKLIVTFALPLMVGNVFQQLYTVVDMMVVGKTLGVDALAALGATDWLYWMVLGMIQGITQGFSILMAREFGAGRREQLRLVTGISIILSAVCALVLLIVCQFAAQPVLELLHTPATILNRALEYIRIMFFGIPIVMAYNLLSCILRSLGDGKTPLSAMILASIVNIALDILFVPVLHWGIVGAAAATLIAQFASCVFCILRLRKVDFMTLGRQHFRVRPALALRLMSLGCPMALQNLMIAVGGMIIQNTVNGFGVAFIAGFTATNKLYGVLEIAASSYGYAMITYAGQNLGAMRFDRIRRGMRAAVLVAVATSAVIAAVMLLFGQSIVGLFISGTPREIAEATKVGYDYLAVMSICLPILYILYVTRSAVQGMGNTVLPMVSGIAEFIMRTGGVLLLPALLHETGIYIAEVLAWFGADLILVPSYFITISRVAKQHGEGRISDGS